MVIGSLVSQRLPGRAKSTFARPATLRRRLVSAVLGLALSLCFAVLLFVFLGVAGNPLYRFVTVEGGSMSPGIPPGSLILAGPIPSTIEPGTVLVMTVDGQLVTHRVVSVAPDGTFVTRGDANNADDPWSNSKANVAGEYIATIPVLGAFIHGDASNATYLEHLSATMTISVGSSFQADIPPTAPISTSRTPSTALRATT